LSGPLIGETTGNIKRGRKGEKAKRTMKALASTEREEKGGEKKVH